MPEEYVVTWPEPRLASGQQWAQLGEWEPMTVLLYEIRDPWSQPLFAPSFAEDVGKHGWPKHGIVVVHPASGEELALIVRMAKRPYCCLTFRATWIDDGYEADEKNDYTERLIDSRRWVGMRPGGVVVRPSTTKVEAIRRALMYCRVRPSSAIETQPEGEDLDAMAGLDA